MAEMTDLRRGIPNLPHNSFYEKSTTFDSETVQEYS